VADDTKPGVFASLLDGFQPVQKVFLWVGFIVFVMGVPAGFTFQNRTLMIGTALLMAGFVGHYLPESRHLDGDVHWGNLVMAIFFFVLFAAACRFAYLGH
jgi:hypothetical protein